jgi:preprotein translocase subunit SecE
VRNLTVLVFVISGILGLYIAAFDALFTFVVAQLATRLG